MVDEPAHVYQFDALGTRWRLSVWDAVSADSFAQLAHECVGMAREFDDAYSRFKPDSLVSRLAQTKGEHEVPADLVAMLRLYEELSDATGGKINPCIGFALSDTGYDAQYSLREAEEIRDVPPLREALTIVDDRHVRLHCAVLLDVGALGKGYLVDRLYERLIAAGLARFMVDGSGDIRYHAADNTPIVCGLEHPLNVTLAIGTLSLPSGALCASATNRRRWGNRHHYIDPHTKESPEQVVATWAWAETAALADGLSSALFFVPPAQLSRFSFEYLVLDAQLHAHSSAGFAAELFT